MRALSPARARPAWRHALRAVVLALAVAPSAAAAPKTDIVELRNGDRITCEIKKLERGKLTVKTDGIGTISVEWDDVDRMTSTTTYDVELESGLKVFGALERGDSRTLVVITAAGPQRLSMEAVVRVTPVRGTFFSRLDGAIDAGFSFAQANSQTQWTLNSDIDYRSRLWLAGFGVNSALTDRDDVEGQVRNTLSFQAQRFWGPRWSTLGFAQFQQNEELSLDLRAVLGGGVQRIMTQSNKSILALVGGAAFTNERYQGVEPEKVAEAVAGVTWEFFTFDGRSTNLDVAVLTFSALNRTRFRLELDTSFKSDIVGDLYWSVSLFESYNGDPPPGGKSNDFTTSAAVGWSF